MSLLRTPKQITLNELQLNCQQSCDEYSNAKDLLPAGELANYLSSIADERQHFANRLDAYIREADDLPSSPDPDKVNLMQLVYAVKRDLADESESEVINQRASSDQQFLQIIDDTDLAPLEEPEKACVNELKHHLQTTLDQLQHWLSHSD